MCPSLPLAALLVVADHLPLPPPRAVPRPELMTSSRPIRPPALPEGVPLAYDQSHPTLPGRIELPAGERVRVPSVDVNEPLALPKLTARPVPAAPADDPTAAAALSAAPPRRDRPAPFLRLTLPNPFEHRDALRLPRLAEDAQPPPPAYRR